MQDVLQACLEDILKTSWRHFRKTYCKYVLKISSRRLQEVLEDKKCYAEDVFKTSWSFLGKQEMFAGYLWCKRSSRSRSRRKNSVNMLEVSEARIKYEASNEKRISNILISCFTSCFKIGLASHLLHDFCNVSSWSNVHKVAFHEARGKNAKKKKKKKIKMAAQQEERLSEAVAKEPVLYHKADSYFKDKAKSS